MTTTAAGTTRSRPPRKLKRPIRCNTGNAVLFLITGMVAVVVVVVAGSLVYISRTAYQAGHQPSPVGAAQGFLYATLQEQDKTAAAKYLCNNATIQRRVDTLINRSLAFLRANPGSSASYHWSDPHQDTRTGNHAVITANVGLLVIQHGVQNHLPKQHWTLGMRDQSGLAAGWKVCSLSITGG